MAYPSASITLNVIGSARVVTSGGDILSISRKGVALVTYLALGRSDSATREQLKGLLWSESPQDKASSSLRQCLRQINTAFARIDFQGFSSDGQMVRLERDTISVDIVDLCEALEDVPIPAPLLDGSLSQEDILKDLDGLDSPLDVWLSVQRRNWMDRILGQLETRIRHAGDDDESGMEAARIVVALDGTHEEACRFIMRFYAARENLGPVLELYANLCKELDESFGTEPSQETVELYLSIKTGGGAGLSTEKKRQSAFVATPPTIGVEKFQWNGEESRSGGVLAAGFRKEMMAALSKFREWIVIDTEARIEQSENWEVDYLLDGTCFQAADYTEVLVTLTETSTGQVWSETPRIETQSWMSAQRTIVSRVAAALNVYLSTNRLTSIVGQRNYPTTVHEEWVRGYEKTLIWEPGSEEVAEQVFRRIIDEIPEFAPAYSSLATVINGRHFKSVGMWRDQNMHKTALALAQRAVELDPMESRAHLALGFSYAMNFRYEQAQLHLELTRELNPISPVTVVPCAHGISFCGRHQEANEMADWAERINWRWMPKFHWGYISCIRLLNKDFKRAIHAAEMADGVIVDLVGWHAAALALDGQLEEAKSVGRKFADIAAERWVRSRPPSNAELAKWFLHCFPIRLKEDLELLAEGLARAGLARANE